MRKLFLLAALLGLGAAPSMASARPPVRVAYPRHYSTYRHYDHYYGGVRYDVGARTSWYRGHYYDRDCYRFWDARRGFYVYYWPGARSYYYWTGVAFVPLAQTVVVPTPAFFAPPVTAIPGLPDPGIPSTFDPSIPPPPGF
jgi:hypothetical protein